MFLRITEALLTFEHQTSDEVANLARIVIAGFQHETNTFGVTKADIEQFESKCSIAARGNRRRWIKRPTRARQSIHVPHRQSPDRLHLSKVSRDLRRLFIRIRHSGKQASPSEYSAMTPRKGISCLLRDRPQESA